MTPFEAIEAELAKVQAQIAELEASAADLETAKRVLLSLTLNGAPAKAITAQAKPERTGAKVNESSPTGEALMLEFRAEAERRGLSVAAASREIFGGPTHVYQLKVGRERDLRRVRAWLKGEASAPSAQPESRAPLGDRRFRENKPPRSFDEQVARVERGEVGIAPAFHAHRAAPDQTLGGVTGEIM